MQKEIITRHFNLGEDQEAMVDEAIDKLERFSPRPVQSMKLMRQKMDNCSSQWLVMRAKH